MSVRFARSLAACRRLAVLPLLAALVSAAPVASAATILVTTNADDDTTNGNCTLREAVRAANTNSAVDACVAGDAGGDTIVLEAIAGQTITLTLGEIVITGGVTIGIDVGGNLPSVTVDAGTASRVYRIEVPAGGGAVALNRHRWINGRADRGGALLIADGQTVRIAGGAFEQNMATGNGGAIYAGNGSLTISNSTFEGNTSAGTTPAEGGGAVFADGGTLAVTATAFTGNLATTGLGNGGALFVGAGGAATVTDATFTGNRAARAGGAIEALGTLAVTGGQFVENETGINGGAVHLTGATTATVAGGTYLRNRAGREGGALWNSATGTLTVSDALVESNVAQGAEANQGGGGVFSTGGPTVLTNLTLRGNRATGAAGSGGGVLSLGPLTMTGGLVEANTSVRAGGGVEINGGTGVVLTDVTLRGNDAGTAPGFGGGVHLTGTASVRVVRGLVEGNTAVEGGGLWKSAPGTLAVEGTAVRTNTATGALATQGGGGVFSAGGPGPLTIADATIAGNRATGAAGSGGGIFANGGSLVVSGGLVTGNTARRAGGGVEINAAAGTAVMTATLASVTITNNNAGAAPGNGGGVHTGGAVMLTVTDGTLTGNTAVEGGGLWINAGGVLTLSGTTFQNNTATGNDPDQGGGGFYSDGGTATLENASFTNNRATGTAGSGGGLLNNGGVLTVRTSTFTGNAANRAGGAAEEFFGATPRGTTSRYSRVSMTNNDGGANPGNGGGLHITGAGRVVVDSSDVRANRTANEGGGLWNSGLGALEVTHTTVAGNTSGRGGGIYQTAGGKGLTTVERSLVSANTATVAGGGLAGNGGTVLVANSTLSGNTAPNGGGAATAGARLLFSNTTIVSNAAMTAGGGLFNTFADSLAARTSLDNSVVGHNTAPAGMDLSGAFMSRGSNLFETTEGARITRDAGARPDLTGLDPRLGPLADNGGPTRTHAVQQGSPLIGAGTTALTTDQRGFARTATPSIGAFEFGGTIVDGESGPVAAAPAGLSPASPNPVRGTSRIWLTVERAEAIEVLLFDSLGRRVRTLWSGTPVAGAPVEVALNGSGLAPGLYVVQVTGETFRASQRVTVVR